MLARTRYRRRYPAQAPIPSQLPSTQTAYVPATQADIREVARYQKREADGFTRPEPYVITQYDARPINAIDFVATFSESEQTGADLRVFNYEVPAGNVAVVRRLDLRIYMNIEARDAVTGAPLCPITANLSVGGNAIGGFNQVRVDDAICGVLAGATSDVLWQNGLSLPLYFIAPEQSIISLTLTNNDAAGFDFDFVAPVLHGNLLLAEGVNPTSEPGTKAALPVFGAHRMATPRVLRPRGV